MAFENARSILGMGSVASAFKLSLISASVSRPGLRSTCLWLLKSFVQDGQIPIRYRCHDQILTSMIRLSDIADDRFTFLELGLRDSYQIDPAFKPDLVIDGGGNTGLFTLWVAGLARSSKTPPGSIVIFEPMPRNAEHIRRHLAANGIEAEVLEGCLGGTARSVPFYCRGAIDSSFDPEKPYLDVVAMPVFTLDQVISMSTAERILVKLDIEGMEMEVLPSLVSSQTRAVYLVGEVHHAAVNGPILESLFSENGWTFHYIERGAQHSTFRACSPTALPLLPSMATR